MSFRVYFEALEIPTTTANICRIVSVPPELIPILNGLLALLTQRWMWDGTDTQIDEMINRVSIFMGQLMDECNVLKNIRINGDRLEAEYYNNPGVWVDIGPLATTTILSANATTLPAGSAATATIASNVLQLGIPEGLPGTDGADGLPGPAPQMQVYDNWIQYKHANQAIWNDLIALEELQGPQGIPGSVGLQGPQGIQGPRGLAGEDGLDGYCNCGELSGFPAPTDIDRICYISTTLAAVIADIFQDLMELIDGSSTVVLGTVRDFFERAASALPVFLGFALDEIAAFAINVIYNVTEAAIDYARTNARDLQTIEAINQYVFCALKETIVEVSPGVYGAPGFKAKLLDITQTSVVEIFVFLNGGVYELDFADTLNQLSGASANVLATAAIYYFLTYHTVLDLGGLRNMLDASVRKLAAQAQYFDDRDCSGFTCGWECDWDFTESDQGFAHRSLDFGGIWNSGVGWQSAVYSDGEFCWNAIRVQKMFTNAVICQKAELYNESVNGSYGNRYRLQFLNADGSVMSEVVDITSPQGIMLWEGEEVVHGVLITMYASNVEGVANDCIANGYSVVTRLKLEGVGESPCP